MADNPFDSLASEYETWYGTPLGSYVIAREQDALLEALAEVPAGRLADIGAGTGWWSRLLARQGWSVTAVEPSEPMARIGIELSRGLPVEWLRVEAASLPLADGSQDAALLFTVVEFLATPDLALREAWRVLRPGGLLIVGHLDPRGSWTATYRAMADEGSPPWVAARFVSDDAIGGWIGAPPVGRWPCVWLGPAAEPPFEEADRWGRLAGHLPALVVLRWRKGM